MTELEERSFQAPRGLYDILPPDSQLWHFMEARFRAVLENASYREIRLPTFEHTELFKRGVGETTDIVNKEMYTFNDRSGRSLTLRPEGTAGVVRAYLNHGLSRQTPPVKLWYCGPMFRYEATQTGRQRQFTQTGIEAFGSAGPAIDAESIALAVDCMHSVGIEKFAVQVNSIGCHVCRPAYRQLLKEALAPKLSTLCEDCRERFERNPLRMLDCKNENCQRQYTDVPTSIHHLCEACQLHWDGLLAHLKTLQLNFVVNERLVRGLDYYSRTVFELISSDSRLGAQSTICAGGRYDYLLESLGGQPTPAVGWALGMERIRLLLDETEVAKPFAFVVSSDMQAALRLVTDVRHAGIPCEMDYPPQGASPRGFKRQIEQANKLDAEWALILGEEELNSGQISVKNMRAGSQEKISLEKLIAFLQENHRNVV